MRGTVFHLGLAVLFTHELDAMTNHEWRVLPLLGSLSDDTARTAFVLAHVPLFAALVAGVAAKDPRIRRWTRLGVAAFLVLHGLLHLLSMGRPSYEFESPVSNGLISAGALLGAAFLALEWRRRTGERSGRGGTG